VLACLVGAPPAIVLGTSHHLAFVPATAIAAAVDVLATRAPANDRYGADEVWRAFLRETAARGDALSIHWAQR
jgi:hypothetical protein